MCLDYSSLDDPGTVVDEDGGPEALELAIDEVDRRRDRTVARYTRQRRRAIELAQAHVSSTQSSASGGILPTARGWGSVGHPR